MKSPRVFTLMKTSVFASALLAVAPAHSACMDDPAPGVDWSECRKRNLILSGYDLRRSDLSLADLSSTDLSGVNLASADLTKAQLTRARLTAVEAPRANFAKTIAGRTDFSNANLQAARFEKAELPRSDFSNADLANADFNRADLGRTVFSGAKLTDPDFSFANLARVDFRNARIEGHVKVTGAFLLNTRLEGVDLTRFVDLAQWQVDMLCGDDNTVLSEGLTRPEDWTCPDDYDE